MTAATGFEFGPLPDGTVLIEFFGDDGKSLNKQVVTADVIRSIPLVAVLTDVALRKGPAAAKNILKGLGRE